MRTRAAVWTAFLWRRATSLRFQMDFRNQIWDDFNLRKLFFAVQNFAAAGFELRQQLVEVETQILGSVVFQIAAAAEVQLLRAANIAVAKMMQANGDLN